MRGLIAGTCGLLAMALALFAALVFLGLREPSEATENSSATAVATIPGDALVARGRYLALAGNCVACHTERGGAPYAGGRAIETPFGRVVGSNLTPDAVNGIGTWNADDFWRALHHGKSKDGHLLYPAFPYPSFTRVTRQDADALFAYLRTVAPVAQPNRAHALRFPWNQRALLALWRGLYFRAGTSVQDLGRDAEWNRGAYLVQGLGHCSACHTPRDGFGASLLKADLSGAMIPMQDWYAPPLNAAPRTGLGDWAVDEVVQLLKTGVSMRGSVSGPMAEVVAKSLQHLEPHDLRAIAVYLKSVPPAASPAVPPAVPPAAPPQHGEAAAALLAAGAVLYERHCKDCHGADGRGMAPAYPPLAGNRSLTQPSAANPIRVVLNGGFAPGTAGNPRPYGMPAYRLLLSDSETAAVVSYIRNAWGNRAALVSAREVDRFRAAPLD